MKYKVKYKDSQQRPHVRYYNALNSNTAKEMFKATVNHSLGNEKVCDIEVLKLDEEEHKWLPTSIKE